MFFCDYFFFFLFLRYFILFETFVVKSVNLSSVAGPVRDDKFIINGWVNLTLQNIMDSKFNYLSRKRLLRLFRFKLQAWWRHTVSFIFGVECWTDVNWREIDRWLQHKMIITKYTTVLLQSTNQHLIRWE